MKKVLFFAPLFVLATACGQKSDVPTSAKEHFKQLFPTATKVNWESEEDGYEAEFKMNGANCSASYDKAGNFKESETEISRDDLPSATKEYIFSELSGQKIKEIVRGSGNDGTVFYEVETAKAEYLFDENGNLTKKMSSEKDNEKDND